MDTLLAQNKSTHIFVKSILMNSSGSNSFSKTSTEFIKILTYSLLKLKKIKISKN